MRPEHRWSRNLFGKLKSRKSMHGPPREDCPIRVLPARKDALLPWREIESSVLELELVDAEVPGLDEVDRTATELPIGGEVFGNRRAGRPEVVKRHEELHATVVGHQIVEQEELHVAAVVAEKGEEVGVARERRSEWAPLA